MSEPEKTESKVIRAAKCRTSLLLSLPSLLIFTKRKVRWLILCVRGDNRRKIILTDLGISRYAFRSLPDLP